MSTNHDDREFPTTLVTSEGEPLRDPDDTSFTGSKNPQSKVSLRECLAVRLLRADGHRPAELADVVGASRDTVRRHANGQCNCPSAGELATRAEFEFLERITQEGER